VVATVGDFRQFRNGAQFGAWIGLTPKQHSSGGKTRLGRITKRGDTYLRTLLIQAAKSAVLTAHRRSDRISSWLCTLRERSGWQIAAGGAGQQERPHSLGAHDQGRGLRRQPSERQVRHEPSANLIARSNPLHRSRQASKMQ
jgi:hypothetical protein